MQLYKFPDDKTLKNIILRDTSDNTKLFDSVRTKIQLVKEKGDSAFALQPKEVSPEEFQAAEHKLPNNLKQAIEMCKRNIWKIHIEQQKEEKEIQTSPGVFCTMKSLPIECIGFYVASNDFSSVLMLGVPAQIAECKNIILCTPPEEDGSIRPEILYAAKSVGITHIFKASGPEAIAAMAYGTDIIPKVMKIFGKGDPAIGLAKQQVALAGIAVDSPYNEPSELAIIIDETAIPVFVAADLIAQAHAENSGKILIFATNDLQLEQVEEQIALQLHSFPNNASIAKTLEKASFIVLKTLENIVEATNAFAPQKLIISTRYYMGVAANITNAGAVFMGNYSPECAGNYAAGINHFIPSGIHVSMYNGVNLDMFVRKIPFLQISKDGLINLSNAIEICAETEGSLGRKNALDTRLNYEVEEDYLSIRGRR